MVRYGNKCVSMGSLRLRFATTDPALKGKERNDPTGFLIWAVSSDGDLILLEDRTRRMNGSDDLLPLMHSVRAKHAGITFYMEDAAHGTEIIRACERIAAREINGDLRLDGAAEFRHDTSRRPVIPWEHLPEGVDFFSEPAPSTRSRKHDRERGRV